MTVESHWIVCPIMTEPKETTGNYEFLGIIDKPKAGVTYKVRNLATGEFETLRTLPGASYEDPESLERFLREIKIHTRLSHPNIIAFHDALELDGQLVMTAEFVEGATLASLCRRGWLASPETIRVIIAVLSGLEEAHDLGIVHRGITAEHVMVANDGQVKVGGFGLAKSASDVGLTQIGAALGDPRYMSPEQVMASGPLDCRADVYAVGIVLFEALTGRVPFDGGNEFEIMVAQVDTPPPRPSSINPGISPELERVVLTALAKKREDRFPTVRDFRSALAALTAPVIVAEPNPAPDPQPIEQLPAWALPPQPSDHSRLPFVLAFAGVALALITLIRIVTQ
jgi:serine/threonine-protein kinase